MCCVPTIEVQSSMATKDGNGSQRPSSQPRFAHQKPLTPPRLQESLHESQKPETLEFQQDLNPSETVNRKFENFFKSLKHINMVPI